MDLNAVAGSATCLQFAFRQLLWHLKEVVRGAIVVAIQFVAKVAKLVAMDLMVVDQDEWMVSMGLRVVALKPYLL